MKTIIHVSIALLQKPNKTATGALGLHLTEEGENA